MLCTCVHIFFLLLPHTFRFLQQIMPPKVLGVATIFAVHVGLHQNGPWATWTFCKLPNRGSGSIWQKECNCTPRFFHAVPRWQPAIKCKWENLWDKWQTYFLKKRPTAKGANQHISKFCIKSQLCLALGIAAEKHAWTENCVNLERRAESWCHCTIMTECLQKYNPL